MYSLENLLERYYRHDRGHDVLSSLTTHHRRGNRHRHFLPGANDLRPADNHPATTHLRQYLADSLFKFGGLNIVRLKRSMRLATHRQDRQADQVGIFFERLLQTRIVAGVVERLDAAGDLERARQAGDNVTVTLAVKFDLPGSVLHQLGLIPAFNGEQSIGAA